LKKIILFVFLVSTIALAQDDYVSVNNSVYNFLQRMETLHIISNYNSFEIPKPRKDIVSYLKQAIASEDKLDSMDKQILNDLKVEFEYELYGTLNNSQSLIGKGKYNIFSQNNKHLFYFSNSDKSSLFINLLGEGEAIFQNNKSTNQNLSTMLGVIGGDIRGTFLNHFGFVLRGTNGDVFGNREVAKLRPDIAQNFKYNLDPAAAFFDETEGYLTADYDMFRIKFGRERMRIGYGPIKSIIDDNAPPFDYLGFNIKYHFFTFSYFHGQLLGNSYFQPDSINGGIQVVAQKYIGYHRIGFNLSDAVNFGAGEIIIYGDRPLDLSYLNPFAFYKSVEHSNQDRDNSLLFFDFNNKSIKGLKIYSTLLIDDIDFSKIGTSWYGNETLFDLGLYSANLYKFLPLDFKLEYTRIDPYVHTHRTGNSNFTNLGYNLGSILKPNSELFLGEINYQFTYRLNLSASFTYILHGANPIGQNGTIINVGGDEALGHRIFDSNNTKLLDGDLEYSRITSASLSFEPFRQIIISLKLIYYNESLQNSITNYQLQSYFDISARF
jgi:hypothetical protein